ncbi:MAG: hypothetical protein IJ703_09540 [Eubacterium sp.]|nr:hypothetical protein [Eubacterium sp.]
MNKKEMLNDIIRSNDEMLRHFTATSNALLRSVQDHQTELFEINIKLDELYRTKSVYSTPSTSRKNVFSPLIKTTEKDEKENELNTQIDDLKLVKDTLDAKIAEEEKEIFAISEKLASLNAAKKSIANLSAFLDKHIDDDDEADGFEFVEEDPEVSEAAKHGTNILMLDAYDDTYNATILDSKVKADLTNNIHRLDILSYLITSDPERARLTTAEISSHLKNTSGIIDNLLSRMHYKLDIDQPIAVIIDDFVTQNRDSHPECVLDSDIKCSDYDKKLSYEKSLAVVKLLNIAFDNIYKHANASKIGLYATINDEAIEVQITDNGKGIERSYMRKSPWYSSLHRAHELIYLLDGNINIKGSKKEGTTFSFRFSVK